MKINYTKYLNQKLNYYEDYIAAVHHSESPGIIIRIAQKYDVTPCLVAKLILQKYLEDHDDCDENNISMYLRDTTLIPNMDLAYEVFLVGIKRFLLLKCKNCKKKTSEIVFYFLLICVHKLCLFIYL